MTLTITKDKLEQALSEAENIGEIDLREDYSGRGMYGKDCFGVVSDDAEALTVFESVLAVLTVTEDLYDTISGADFIEALSEVAQARRQDSMGLGTIWYYPGITVEEED